MADREWYQAPAPGYGYKPEPDFHHSNLRHVSHVLEGSEFYEDGFESQLPLNLTGFEVGTTNDTFDYMNNPVQTAFGTDIDSLSTPAGLLPYTYTPLAEYGLDQTTTAADRLHHQHHHLPHQQLHLGVSAPTEPPPAVSGNLYDPASHLNALGHSRRSNAAFCRTLARPSPSINTSSAFSNASPFSTTSPTPPDERYHLKRKRSGHDSSATSSPDANSSDQPEDKHVLRRSISDNVVNESTIPGYLVMKPDGINDHKRHRSHLSPQARLNTAAVRQRGACFKCRMWRKKCDLSSPCQNCKDDPHRCNDTTTIFSQPCFRLDLDQCGFFRKRSALWKNPLRDQMKWVSRAQITLSVQCSSLLDSDYPVFDIPCSHFQPETDDIVHRKYGSRGDQLLDIPTYCAVNTRRLKEQIPLITDKHTNYLLRRYEKGVEKIHPVVLEALKIARAQEHCDSLLKVALKLWVSSRFLAAPRSLRGEERLGLEPIGDRNAHDHGYIPIPPMLDYQIDTMTIRWLTEQTERMLKEMWKKLTKKTPSNWFSVFLTIFLLLDNLEGVHHAQNTFIEEHGASDFGRFIHDFSQPMLDQWEWTSKHLLFVFRYYVRRCALDNRPIFSEDQYEECAEFARLDHQQQQLYRRLISWRSELVQRQNDDFDHFEIDNTDHPTSWCSQLLFTGLEEDSNG